jgi:hypothetical protein
MGGWIAAGTAAGVGAAIAGGYVGVVTGALAIDLGVGRRTRALGTQTVKIGAPRGRRSSTSSPPGTWRASRGTLRRRFGCWSAAPTWCWPPIAHRCVDRWWPPRSKPSGSPGRSGWTSGWSAARCRTSSSGSTLTATNTGTTLDYRGELGTDLWRIGQRWGDLVADQWERAVATSLEVIKAEAERRASLGARTRRT